MTFILILKPYYQAMQYYQLQVQVYEAWNFKCCTRRHLPALLTEFIVRRVAAAVASEEWMVQPSSHQHPLYWITPRKKDQSLTFVV